MYTEKGTKRENLIYKKTRSVKKCISRSTITSLGIFNAQGFRWRFGGNIMTQENVYSLKMPTLVSTLKKNM